MYHTALRIMGNSVEAQDVVQESFVKVFAKIGSYRGEATIGAWIKRVVVNTAINAIRKNKRNPEILVDEGPEMAEPDDTEESYWSPAMLHSAICELPDGCRTILNLYAFEGYAHKEIAELLHITESTSKTQYRRAKKLLRDLLTQEKAKNEY